MSDEYTAGLITKIETKRNLIEVLKGQATEQGRDLTDEELAQIDGAITQVRGWNGQLEKLSVDLELAEDAAHRLQGLGRSGAIANGDFSYRSDGDLLWDVLHQSDPDAFSRYRRAVKRAAEHMGTLASATTPTAGDMAGLVVRPVVGPVINPYSYGMPLASAIGLRDVPASSGYGFARPQVVDTSFTTGTGVQALQKGELPSKAFSITATNVDLTSIGGYLNISQQLLSFQPESLSLIIEQLRLRLEQEVEAFMFNVVNTGATKITLSLTATASEILAAIYQAAAAYYNTTKTMPNWLAMGPSGWARLGGLVDAAGRPLFPTLGAGNAPGTMSADAFSATVAGLQAVVTPAITDATFYVGGTAAVEGYLYRYPILEAVEPSVMGRQVAIMVSVAGYKPTPFAGAVQWLAP